MFENEARLAALPAWLQEFMLIDPDAITLQGNALPTQYLLSTFDGGSTGLLLYLSSDLTHFSKAVNGFAVTDAAHFRDPVLAKIGTWYYLTYTNNGLVPGTGIGMKKTQDFVHWTTVTTPNWSSLLAGGNTTFWNGCIVQDAGVCRVFFSTALGSPQIPYAVTFDPATDTFGTPAAVTGTSVPANAVFTSILKVGSSYIALVQNDPDEANSYIAKGVSSSLTSGWTFTTGDWAGWGNAEAGSLIVTPTGYRAFMAKTPFVAPDSLYYSDSADLSTWSAPVPVANLTGNNDWANVIAVSDLQSLSSLAATSASAQAPVLPADTARGLAAAPNPDTGDAYGVEQVSAAQTGTVPATRLFTSNRSSGDAYIAFGRYTNGSDFTEYGRFAPLTGNFLVGTTTDNGTDKFQVGGSVLATDFRAPDGVAAIVGRGNVYTVYQTISGLNGGNVNLVLTAVTGAFCGISFADDWFMQRRDNGDFALYSNALAKFGFYIDSATGVISFADALSVPGDVVITTAGKSLSIKAGTNAKAGTFTLASGTATIGNTSVTANSVICVTLKTANGTRAVDPLITPTAGTGFTAVGTATDNGVYNYVVLEVGL